MRVQRTRSSASRHRRPLTRHPSGRSIGQRAALIALALAFVACATTPSGQPTGCGGAAVEFGTLRASALMFRVVTSDTTGVRGYWWRYRKEYIFPGRWSEWAQVQDQECHVYDSCGWGGMTDQEDGLWELEICAAGFRPLHGFLNLRDSGRGGGWITIMASPDV